MPIILCNSPPLCKTQKVRSSPSGCIPSRIGTSTLLDLREEHKEGLKRKTDSGSCCLNCRYGPSIDSTCDTHLLAVRRTPWWYGVRYGFTSLQLYLLPSAQWWLAFWTLEGAGDTPPPPSPFLPSLMPATVACSCRRLMLVAGSLVLLAVLPPTTGPFCQFCCLTRTARSSPMFARYADCRRCPQHKAARRTAQEAEGEANARATRRRISLAPSLTMRRWETTLAAVGALLATHSAPSSVVSRQVARC
jgi:hypothetical protein